jgi:hypothetical protein
LGLQEPVECKLVIFFLVSLAVRVGAELSATGPPLQERQLLAAIQTPHVAIIVFFALLLKSALTGFYALKHLYAGFEGNTLVGITLMAVEPRAELARFAPAEPPQTFPNAFKSPCHS